MPPPQGHDCGGRVPPSRRRASRRLTDGLHGCLQVTNCGLRMWMLWLQLHLAADSGMTMAQSCFVHIFHGRRPYIYTGDFGLFDYVVSNMVVGVLSISSTNRMCSSGPILPHNSTYGTCACAVWHAGCAWHSCYYVKVCSAVHRCKGCSSRCSATGLG